nr:stage III sporulation protein AF [uncultured Agathobaculum sp.]
MTELFQTILLRVTLAGAASAIALRLVGGGALREIVKMAAALLLLLALLQPLGSLRGLSWKEWMDASQTDVNAIEQRNAQTAMSTIAATIARTVEQRAGQEGFDCSVRVTMANDADGVLQIDRVTIYYNAVDTARLTELQTIVTEECGIPAERQELIAR